MAASPSRVKAQGTDLKSLVSEGSAFIASLDKHFGAYSPAISTSTCHVTFTHELDIAGLLAFSQGPDWDRLRQELELDIMHLCLPGDKYKRGPRKPLKTFNNCQHIIMKVPSDGTKICANVFRNRVNFTGVRKNWESFDIACTAIYAIFYTMSDIDIGIKSWSLSMVNAIIDLGKALFLQEVASRLDAIGYRCAYDPNGFPGIVVKWPPSGPIRNEEKEDDDAEAVVDNSDESTKGWFSAFVFASGKVTMCGMQSHADVQHYVGLVDALSGMHV